MTDTQEALKPCPFCGSDEVSRSMGKRGDGSPFPYIECEECGCNGEPEVWNRRATPEAETPAVRDALIAMLERHTIYCGDEGLPFAGHTDVKLFEMARAALEPAPVQGWRTFETAPKDQTRILAFRFDRLFCVWWSGEWEGWLDDAGNPRNYDFTHWMPIEALFPAPQEDAFQHPHIPKGLDWHS